MSEQQAFRDAMSRLGAAVNIVTTDGPAGMAGFTASAVCSVTDSPPTLLVCLNRNASVWPVFQANGQLCVNTLAAARWRRGVTGSPQLDGAVVSFDCRVEQVVPVSTHDVLLCRVLEISRNDDTHGLVWFDRHYHALSRPVCGLAS
ncbi:flavin reductase [Cronobacter turicensis]